MSKKKTKRGENRKGTIIFLEVAKAEQDQLEVKLKIEITNKITVKGEKS